VKVLSVGSQPVSDRRSQRVSRMRGFRHWRWHHATLHNHFNAERHLVDRQTFKLHCSAALAEWPSFAA